MTLGINEITKVLQHRYPFLLIDRIQSQEYGKYVEAIKNVSVNEPWATGHFPGNPIYPGVLTIESSAQAGGFLFYNENDSNPVVKGVLARVDNFKFVKEIRPGDQLLIRVDLVNRMGNFVQAKVKITVDSKKVAEGDLTYAVSE